MEDGTTNTDGVISVTSGVVITNKVTSNVTSVISKTRSETDITDDAENVIDVIPRTNPNTIIHVNEQNKSENEINNTENKININVTDDDVTTNVIDVTRTDNTTIIDGKINNSQEPTVVANKFENTACRIDINYDTNCNTKNESNNENNTEHLYRDYEHLHCQVIEVKGYSNHMVYENDNSDVNICSASNPDSSLSSQKQCNCNCHINQSHLFANSQSHSVPSTSNSQSNSVSLSSNSQSNPVPSTSNSQLNSVLEQSSSSQSTSGGMTDTTVEIGLDNASFEILRDNSITSSSDSVKPPTYKSLGEFYLNDEPPKYEAITGKKLADELVSVLSFHFLNDFH